jgi:hypothetical protein
MSELTQNAHQNARHGGSTNQSESEAQVATWL